MRTIECRSDLRAGASRIISIVGMLGLIVGLGGLWTRPARAEIQNDAIGFTPNHVFDSTDKGEHIDVMTGNLMLTIPIGPRYKLNETFDYGVTLYYNAKIWKHECPPPDPSIYPPPVCKGSLEPENGIGLGFSIIPGRVYRDPKDKAGVYRLQLEDGSEHFFCNTPYSGCNVLTNDGSGINVYQAWLPGTNNSVLAWKAEFPDGHVMYFGQNLGGDAEEALATRIESTERRSNGDAAEWVTYSYPAGGRRPSQIQDSHGRLTTLSTDDTSYCPTGGSLTIEVPGFGNSESPNSNARAQYVLCRTGMSFSDPSDGNNDSYYRTVLKSINFPSPITAAYTFSYDRSTEQKRYGWLLTRILPTGATIDYFYDVYRTSELHPYHTELRFKTLRLTAGGTPFTWHWYRFQLLESWPPGSISPTKVYAGSNPHQVSVLDPFNNLAVYDFAATTWDLGSSSDCDSQGECRETWSDGLLQDVSVFAGPQPDSSRLVRRTEFTWDSDRDEALQHRLFQYRKDDAGTTLPVRSTAVNARQIDERTVMFGAGGSPGHSTRVARSDWSSMCPRQSDEYVDDVLYRSTRTEATGAGCPTPLFTEVDDASGNLLSRVDRRFDSNRRLLCEVNRKGTGHHLLGGCSDTGPSGLNLQPGDVAIINEFDQITFVTTKTTMKGGDDPSVADRVTKLDYLLAGGERTGYLKTKLYGTPSADMQWNAVNRSVDFNTGLTFQTQDPAGFVTSYQWDALGRLTHISPPSPEFATDITYSNDFRETRVIQGPTSGNHLESVYDYDNLGRLVTTKRRDIGGSFDVQWTEYDIAGRVTRKSEWAPDGTADSNRKWTSYNYTIYADLDAAAGYSTSYPDPLGRIHGVTTPDDLTPETPTTEATYSGDKTIVTVRNIRGWVNGADRPDITSTTTYTKDAFGRLIAVDSPGDAADAEYTYDELDNLTEVRLTDPTSQSHVQVRRFNYDRLGRLRGASNPENGTIEYTSYDARGNLLSYIDAAHNVFKMTYDSADRLLKRVQMNGSVELLLSENKYDAIAGFDFGGSTGRLVEQDSYRIDNVFNGTSWVPASNLVSTVRFGYGAVTNSSNSPCSDSRYGFPAYIGLNGRLSWQTSSIQPWGADLRSDYCQDAFGMPTLVGYPDYTNSLRTRSRVVASYANGYFQRLDDFGRKWPYITSVNYAPGGAPIEIDRPLSNDYIELDARHRPIRFRLQGHPNTTPPPATLGYSPVYPHMTADPGSDPGGDSSGGDQGGGIDYAQWDTGYYAYDMAGNVKTIGSEQYHYDSSSRLIHASIPGIGLSYLLDYAFDAFGNMTAQSRTTSPSSTIERDYTNDWQTNHLVSQSVNGGSPVGYSYDGNGNMVVENMTATSGRNLVFDAQGRMREVVDSEDGRLGKYDYDAAGYRVRTEVGGIETFYFRDASGQVLSEFQRAVGSTSTPVWNKDYIYALGKSFALVKNQTPDAPKRPWATNVTPTSLTLNWSLVSAPDIAWYNVERRYKASASAPEVVSVYAFSSSTQSWSDSWTTVADGATYLKYTITAIDSAYNPSAASPQLTVFPRAVGPPPSPPQNVNHYAGDRWIMITWNPPTTSTVQGWIVERSTSQTGTYVRLNDDLLTVPEYLDTGLQNGTTYWYHVRTVDTANHTSGATEVSDTPFDHLPPGKILNVYAEPDRAANRIIVSWTSSDGGASSYAVYRRTDDAPPTSDAPIGTVSAVPGQLDYRFIDSYALAGTTYFYSVKAFDSATPPNASNASDRASARARFLTSSPAAIVSVVFSVDDNGTTNTDGLPVPANVNGANTEAEADDVMRAAVTFHPGTDLSYHVYRKAPDEAHFTRVPDQVMIYGQNYVFNDPTISRGDYTYFVAGVNTDGEETAGSEIPADGHDHFVQHGVIRKSVRNVTVTDGRKTYTTDNKESRLATVKWSRVVEPELVGYNVYRMCDWRSGGDSGLLDQNETFVCEPVWIRLNSTPIAPNLRVYQDSSIDGLQGTYFYAVRPVGPNRVEGPIGKIVVADLAAGALPDTPYTDHSIRSTAGDEFAPWTLDPQLSPPACTLTNCPDHTADYILNQSPAAGSNDPPAINNISRGTYDPTAPVPAPSGVTQYILDRNEDPYVYGHTKFARISWTLTNPPSDLVGFHIETAGSPSGPWQRLTKHPVAWWERMYVAQGVGLARCNDYSGHTGCLSYRVIAVDEDGNESEPAYPGNLPPAGTCPSTPNPPTGLRASTVLPASGCTTHLEWDAPTEGAEVKEYYVYRAMIVPSSPAFFDTQRIAAIGSNPPVTFYDETGDPRPPSNGLTCADVTCGFVNADPPGSYQCSMAYLSAYYVTARGATGGESPRSNLVFSKCGADTGSGYTKLVIDSPVTEAVASLQSDRPDESLAYWLTGGPQAGGSDAIRRTWETTLPSTFAAAPMLQLGSVLDPAWRIFDLHTDHLGTVRAVTNDWGSMVSTHNYFPFGEEIAPQQLSYNAHKYTGHERDRLTDTTELDYMKARYYTAALGPWADADEGTDSEPWAPASHNRFVVVRK